MPGSNPPDCSLVWSWPNVARVASEASSQGSWGSLPLGPGCPYHGFHGAVLRTWVVVLVPAALPTVQSHTVLFMSCPVSTGHLPVPGSFGFDCDKPPYILCDSVNFFLPELHGPPAASAEPGGHGCHLHQPGGTLSGIFLTHMQLSCSGDCGFRRQKKRDLVWPESFP